MNLTILGGSGVRPHAGDACAGYLVRQGEHAVLLDCGPAVTGPLLDALPLSDLDAVLLSHAHPDHCLDLVMVRQSIAYSPRGARSTPLPVYVGPGVEPVLRSLGAAFDADDYWAPHIEIRSFDPESALTVPGFFVTFMRTAHGIPCWAMRLRPDRSSDPDAPTDLVYGADGGPDADLAGFAAGAATLLAEATLPERAGYESYEGHMSAAEAGEAARRAGVRRLILTHRFEGNDPATLLGRAAAACPGTPVSFARQGDRYAI